MLALIPYPDISPIAFSLGPLQIRWYALAYITGLLLGWRYCMWLAGRPPAVCKPLDIDDFLIWATAGVVLGGRSGYVLFYDSGLYAAHPLEIFEVWHGGMSFHGGCIGVITAIILFALRRRISILGLGDIICCAVPIGLFFGRLANFINGELFGRVTDVAWAMIFPNGGPLPRHPSQLYQASMEGIILFAVLTLLERLGLRQRPGVISGTFLMGYAVARSIGELFRQPDSQIGFLVFGTTMGQLLSLPMFLAGAWLIIAAKPLGKPAT